MRFTERIVMEKSLRLNRLEILKKELDVEDFLQFYVG
jgi:hypothetical protein